MSKCRICKKDDCDDDCEERLLIYRAHRAEQLRDIELEETEFFELMPL